MFLYAALRFKGYWAGLFAWLVLTFAIPVSGMAGDPQSGWMRLCSGLGVHWVQVDEASPAESSVQCGCLALAVTFEAPAYSVPSGQQQPAGQPLPLRISSTPPPYQPRSPPALV